MKLSKMIFKNIKYNIKSYTAYLVGNTFIIAILFMFVSLIFSDVFMKNLKNSPQDSAEMLQMMIILMTAFSVVFIFYTTVSFTKYRGREFGVYFTIGLTSKNIITILLYQNLTISVLAFILGALFGSLFSKLFYMAIIKILYVSNMNMSSISIEISLKAYLYVIFIAILIFIFNILYQVRFIKKFSIAQILKSNAMKYKGKANDVLGCISILVFAVAMLAFGRVMTRSGTKKDTVVLYSILACIVSLYFIIGFIITLSVKVSRHFKKFYNNNILCLNSLSHRFIEYRLVLYVVILLIAGGMAFISISYSAYKSSKDSINRLYPYDLSFIIEKDLYNADLEGIIRAAGAKIKSFSIIEGINVPNLKVYGNEVNWIGMPIMATSQSEFNKLSNSNVAIDNSSAVFCYVSEKEHEAAGIVIDFSKEEDYKKRQINSIFTTNKILLNNYIKVKGNKGFIYIPKDKVKYKEKALTNTFNEDNQNYFAPFTRSDSMVLSDKTYRKLKENSSSKVVYYDVLVNLYNNSDCKSIEKNLSQKLNKLGGEKLKVTLIVKEIKFQQYLGNTLFTLFTFMFFGLMLLVGSAVTLYFKIFTSIEGDRKLVNQLVRIGLTEGEINNILSKEIAAVFLIPPIIAISIVSYFVSKVYIEMPFGKYLWQNSLIVFLVYALIQVTFFIITVRRYLVEIRS